MKTFIRSYAGTPLKIPVGAVAVTVYFKDRSYGGPEEGGWYYADPVVSSVYLFRSLRKAKMHMRKVRSELGRDHFVELEYAGADPIGTDPDGFPCRERPWNLRPVYRGHELVCRPYYC
jgi:hypothetical protein